MVGFFLALIFCYIILSSQVEDLALEGWVGILALIEHVGAGSLAV